MMKQRICIIGGRHDNLNSTHSYMQAEKIFEGLGFEVSGTGTFRLHNELNQFKLTISLLMSCQGLVALTDWSLGKRSSFLVKLAKELGMPILQCYETPEKLEKFIAEIRCKK